MDWSLLELDWEKWRGRVGSQWKRLSEPDLKRIAGKRPVLVTLLQRRYGIASAEAEQSVGLFLEIVEKEEDLDALLRLAHQRQKDASPSSLPPRHASASR